LTSIGRLYKYYTETKKAKRNIVGGGEGKLEQLMTIAKKCGPSYIHQAEPEFENLLRNPGIDS
jgi:hypothetical protein